MLQSNRAPAATGEWECMECGYIEEGSETARPAKCPECNAASDAFEFFSYDEEEEWEGDAEEDDDEDEEFEEDFDEDADDFEDDDEEYDDELDDDYDELDDDR